jgi:hypothetical protein
MAKIRVLATRLGTEYELVPRIAYAAQVFEDSNDIDAVWTCIHEHKTAVDAQLCGVEFVTDRGLNRGQRGAA